jgi:hypothetical protein
MFGLSDNRVPQWLSDPKTNLLLDANDAALQFWRYSREQFIGLPATDLLSADEVPRSEYLKHRNLWGETGPWKCRRGDGSLCFVKVRWHQIMYNGHLSDFAFLTALGENLESLQPTHELLETKAFSKGS